MLLASIACCAALLLFVSGCCLLAAPGPAPAKTVSADQPREATWVEATAAATADPCVPQPTDAVPAGYEVETGIAKDPITGEITVKVNGGKGLSLLQSMEVRVVHPDSSDECKVINQPKVNDEVTIPGTKDGSDRVVIEKTYSNGAIYITDDALIAGRELRTGGQGGGGGGGC
ncbi:MAG: hypothetical protein APR53_07855 [Methanoculleus sp. SDB]|nr:MAG: hypothetical protein APR53_07855 [Methanoculleus sp. SDB]